MRATPPRPAPTPHALERRLHLARPADTARPAPWPGTARSRRPAAPARRAARRAPAGSGSRSSARTPSSPRTAASPSPSRRARPERPDVAARVGRLAPQLLRRHVRQRPRQRPRLRQRLRAMRVAASASSSPASRFARPKSSTLTRPSGVMTTLALLKSRCTTPRACACASASASCCPYRSDLLDRQRATGHPVAERLPLDELHRDDRSGHRCRRRRRSCRCGDGSVSRPAAPRARAAPARSRRPGPRRAGPSGPRRAPAACRAPGRPRPCRPRRWRRGSRTGRGEHRTKGTSAVRRIVAPEASAPTDRVHPTRSAAGSPVPFSGCRARCSARSRHPWAWACSCSRGRALCGPSEQVLAAERSTRARRTRAGANRRALRIGAETAGGPPRWTSRVCAVLHLRYHATGSTRQRFAAGPQARRAVAAAATTSSDSRGAA